MRYSLDNLDTDTLARLDDQELEDFCYQLIDYEVQERHDDPELDGPGPDNVGDGGRDIRLVIRNPPLRSRRDFRHALTWDEGETWYSCKTGDWKKGVRDDVGPKRETLEKKASDKQNSAQSVAALAVLATPEQRPSEALLKLLCQPDGRYIILTNRRAEKKSEFRTEVAERLGFWIEALLQRPAPVDIRNRIDICDAHDLAGFVRYQGPVLSGKLIAKLGIREPKGLNDWKGWTQEFDKQRRMLPFQADSQRRDIIDRIADLVAGSAAPPLLWLAGPPGVGKTRTAHHALAQALSSVDRRRVRYADDWQRVDREIRDGLCEQRRDLILVVDEVIGDGAETLATNFLAHCQDTSCALVLIGPLPTRSSGMVDLEPHTVHLQPLPKEETRLLVVEELETAASPSDPLAERILALAQGYPLFAFLLAQAAGADGQSIDEPDIDKEWTAARMVLAGHVRHYGGDSARRDAEAYLRARALVLVLIAPRLDWAQIDEALQDRLCRAVKAPSWHELERAARECEERGLLRFAQGRTRRYVSPHNLARMLINHFFRPGPDNLGPALRKHASEYRDGLYAMAEALPVARAVLETLAAGELDEIEASLHAGAPLACFVRRHPAYDWLASTMPGHAYGSLFASVSTTGFVFVARWQQERAASILGRIPGTVERAALRANEAVRIWLRHAYRDLRRRPLSAAAFAAVEAGMFGLAEAESAIMSDSVHAEWATLFAPGHHPTGRPFAERFAILRQRCLNGALERRLRALDVACAMPEYERPHTGASSLPFAISALDDDDDPGEADIAQALHAAWSLVLALTGDEDPRIAHRARIGVTGWLVCAPERLAVEEVDMLAREVHGWAAEERRALADSLSPLSQDAHAGGDPAMAAALAALRTALMPASYRERLLARVHSWDPDADLVALPPEERARGERERDAALAAEGLASPALLLDEIALLADARRGPVFAVEIGRLDADQVLLAALVERARAGEAQALLAHYLLGWGRRAGAAAVDAWIERHLDEPALYPALARAIALLGGSRQRLRWLQAMLDTGALEPIEVAMVGTGAWADAVDTETLCAFASKLAQGTAKSVRAALPLGGTLARRHRMDMPAAVAEVLGALLGKAASMGLGSSRTRLDWERMALILLEHGHIDAVLAALVAAFRSPHDPGVPAEIRNLWRHLVKRGEGEALWGRLSPLLEESREVRLKLQSMRLLAVVSPAVVLDWVGDDLDRGIWVAELCMPHDEPLDEVCRGLLIRFGAESAPAHVLMERALSAPRGPRLVQAAPDELWRRQSARAQAWTRDAEPAVARWAETLATRLSQVVAENEAHQRLQRQVG